LTIERLDVPRRFAGKPGVNAGVGAGGGRNLPDAGAITARRGAIRRSCGGLPFGVQLPG